MLEDTGTSYEVAVMPWARAIALASTQAMHCVFAAARTPEREKQFKWVTPIHIDRNILVARRKANVEASSLDEARKYRVGTQRGDYTEALLQSSVSRRWMSVRISRSRFTSWKPAAST